MEIKIQGFYGSTMLYMQFVRGGTFLMGSPLAEPERGRDEGPQHEVSIPAFSIGKYAVTNAQWRAMASLTPVNFKLDPDPSFFKAANCPVQNISWYEAMEFCARLSRLTDKLYTLPSEAQWEYACRAGTTTAFHFGGSIHTEQVNCVGKAPEWCKNKGQIKSRERPLIAGCFPPNDFGLYDMHGNVWEWCLDYYHDNYEGVPTDGSAWVDINAEQDKPRVLRGGSWLNLSQYCRSAFRGCSKPSTNNYSGDIGFRVVTEE